MTKILTSTLTLAGTLPFMVCAFCLAIGITTIPWLGTTEQILTSYALIISTFMSGSHWGQHLLASEFWQVRLATYSNLQTIFVWIGFLSLPFTPLCMLFAINFSLLLAIDKQLYQHQLISTPYFRIRCVATGIVVIALIITGAYR